MRTLIRIRVCQFDQLQYEFSLVQFSQSSPLCCRHKCLFLVIFAIGGSKRDPNYLIFMHFWENFDQIIGWRPTLEVGAPSSGKSWIRHC